MVPFTKGESGKLTGLGKEFSFGHKEFEVQMKAGTSYEGS